MSEAVDEDCGVAPKHVAIYTRWTDKEGKEHVDFEDELALAALLMNRVVFLNSNWWAKDWPEAAQKTIALCVNCNDVFAWGCADAEAATYGDLQEVYEHWHKDPSWGASVWCIKKRGQMPQQPVEKRIRDAGIWNLDLMGLKPNYYDGVSGVLAHRKYDAYVEWAKKLGQIPYQFLATWWKGWEEYVQANPEWNSSDWKAADDAAIAKWRHDNGWAEVES